jgi:glycine C-acetyltransferase
MINAESQHTFAFSKSVGHFARPSGSNLLERTGPFGGWISEREDAGVYPYSRALESPPLARGIVLGSRGERWEGINCASQDYLALSSHPAIKEEAIRALHDYGPHSAGSGLLAGNTVLSRYLENRLSELLGFEHVALFPTGWGAGFSAIAGLVRNYDHVVMDELAHACLQQGAAGATEQIHRFKHCDNQKVHEVLREIRSSDTENGILVVTEGLFSMNSDYPDLAELQAICRDFSATLLVDVAHDLGSLGFGPGGTLEIQGIAGKVDLLVGAFSKTFASNGGFIATHSAAVKHFIRWNGGPHIFSNALSPVQAAVVAKAVEIVSSPEGSARRKQLLRNAMALRTGLESKGVRCLGIPSAIVPVMVGSEKVARLTSLKILQHGLIGNLVEFPAVKLREARLRLQLMSTHSVEDMEAASSILAAAIEEAQTDLAH